MRTSPFLKKERGVEARRKEYLPSQYFHLFFTLPDELKAPALCNREVLYHILFRAAPRRSRNSRIRGSASKSASPPSSTPGQKPCGHVHLRGIVPGGGLSQGRWISLTWRFLLPVKVMSRFFRGKFLSYLKKACYSEEPPTHTAEEFLRRVYTRERVVYSRPMSNGPKTVPGHLGSHAHLIAITNHPIGVENGKVSFIWKDSADGNTQKIMTFRHCCKPMGPRGAAQFFTLFSETRHRKRACTKRTRGLRLWPGRACLTANCSANRRMPGHMGG